MLNCQSSVPLLATSPSAHTKPPAGTSLSWRGHAWESEMLNLINTIAGLAIAESFVDNVIRAKVSEPDIGGVVYCDLISGVMEHSGIYIGNNRIVHLNSKGWIETVTPAEFIENTTAISIYTSCRGTRPVGDPWAADSAQAYLTSHGVEDYNLIWRNCHIFSAWCITGDRDNACTFLWMLKHACEKSWGVNSWRVWER